LKNRTQEETSLQIFEHFENYLLRKGQGDLNNQQRRFHFDRKQITNRIMENYFTDTFTEGIKQ
jgi:hypothetical protein